jgi:triacylglycerol lipase
MDAIKNFGLKKQAWIFAILSKHSYLEEPEGKAEFSKLGFDSFFIDIKGSQAYVLQNKNDLIVICRGTQAEEFEDIKTDLSANWVPSSTGTGKVHYGFKTSADAIWPNLVEILSKYPKTKTIWCTGHSLGGALATIIAYKCQRTKDMPKPQALFTFGSPKVGNKEYITSIESSGVVHHRFVNNVDIVTTVPPWPYEHFGELYFIDHKGNIKIMDTKQVIKTK